MAQHALQEKTLRTQRVFTRRPRNPQGPPQQRLHRTDAAWLTLFVALVLVMRFVIDGTAALTSLDTYLSAATVILLYFLGFRVRDRTTAIVATALLASSPLFITPTADGVRDLLFVVLTVAALLLYASGSDFWILVSAVVVAAGATIVRPEGILLGAVLLGLMFTERRPGWIVGSIVYFVLTIAGLAFLAYVRQPIPVPTIRLDFAPIKSLFDAQTAITAWFIWPLIADLSDSARRARWKPIIAWSVLFLCVESLFHFPGYSFDTGPFRPILFLLAAGGLSRLLPVIAGDFANPSARYIIAILAVGSLVYARINTELSAGYFPSDLESAPSASTFVPIHIAPQPSIPPPQIQRAVPSSVLAARHPVSGPPIGTVRVANVETHQTAQNNAAAVKMPVVQQKPGAGPSLATVPNHVVFVPSSNLKPHTEASASPVRPATAANPALHAIPSRPMAATNLAPSHLAAPVAPGRVASALVPSAHPAVVKPIAPTHPAPTKVAVAVKPAIKPVPGLPMSLVTAASAAGVAVYSYRHGRTIVRSPWAIQWDISHKPKPAHFAVAAKPALIPAKAPVHLAAIPARPVPTRVASLPKPQMPARGVPAARPQVHVATLPKPVAKPVVHPAVEAVPGVPAALVAQANAAHISVYTLRYGRIVPRTAWAIQWDITHKTNTAPKAYAHVARPHAVARSRRLAHGRRPGKARRHRSIWAIRWSASHAR